MVGKVKRIFYTNKKPTERVYQINTLLIYSLSPDNQSCYRTSKLINKLISSVAFFQPMGLKVNVLPHLWDAFGDFSVKNLFVHGDTCFYATLID